MKYQTDKHSSNTQTSSIEDIKKALDSSWKKQCNTLKSKEIKLVKTKQLFLQTYKSQLIKKINGCWSYWGSHPDKNETRVLRSKWDEFIKGIKSKNLEDLNLETYNQLLIDELTKVSNALKEENLEGKTDDEVLRNTQTQKGINIQIGTHKKQSEDYERKKSKLVKEENKLTHQPTYLTNQKILIDSYIEALASGKNDAANKLYNQLSQKIKANCPAQSEQTPIQAPESKEQPLVQTAEAPSEASPNLDIQALSANEPAQEQRSWVKTIKTPNRTEDLITPEFFLQESLKTPKTEQSQPSKKPQLLTPDYLKSSLGGVSL